MISIQNFLTFSIANGESLSAGVKAVIDDRFAVAVAMPGTWTAAPLTFQISTDGVTYRNVVDGFGTELTAEAAASVHIPIPGTALAGGTYLRIRSGTSGVPVNQGGARTLILAARTFGV